MEIRRSVMGRPNLSVKGTVVGGSGKETRAGTSRRALPFQCASFEAREARTFLPAPSGRVSLRSPRDSLRPLRLRAFIAEHAENIRGVYGKSYPLPPQPGYARRPGWSETQFIIELAVLKKVSRFLRRRQSLCDRRVGQRRHGSVVRFDIFEAHGAGGSSDVIGAGENDHNLGMKINHVLPEADEHLRRGLASDAAVDVGLAGKVFLKMPDVGDRVAEEYGAVLARRRRLEGGGGLAIAGEFAQGVANVGSF